MSAVAQEGFELRREASSLWPLVRHLLRSWSLIRILARKDFYVRYRRASFGILWAVGLPLVQAGVLAVVLSRLTIVRSPIPLAAYVYSGILPFNTFINGVTGGTTSIVDNTAVATRIYFPRAVFPFVAVASNFYSFVPGLAVLLVLHAALGGSFGPALFLLVPATLLLLLLTCAFALVLSALQVYFRDVKHILAAVTLPWFWASGIFFDPARLKTIGPFLKWNPVVGVIQLFRAALYAGGSEWVTAVWITIGWTVVLVVAALLLHRRYDRVFVDLL